MKAARIPGLALGSSETSRSSSCEALAAPTARGKPFTAQLPLYLGSIQESFTGSS